MKTLKSRFYIHIGTSGWSYNHWEEFYQGYSSSEWLPYYAEHFSTVEINSTFYHLPQEKSVKNWAKITPKEFIFSAKVSRYITHVKRLKDIDESMEKYFKAIAPLKLKLGPLLFLLPPSFKLNLERLKECLAHLPKRFSYAFEFRHESWHDPAVYHLLKKHGVAFCISDLNGKCSPIEVTAPFVYIRLHGPKKAYQGSYSLQALKRWAKRIEEWKEKKHDVYLYFDNDEKGYAIKDAKRLMKLLS